MLNADDAPEERSTPRSQKRGGHHVVRFTVCHIVRFRFMCTRFACKGTWHSNLRATGAAVTGISGKDSQGRKAEVLCVSVESHSRTRAHICSKKSFRSNAKSAGTP